MSFIKEEDPVRLSIVLNEEKTGILIFFGWYCQLIETITFYVLET